MEVGFGLDRRGATSATTIHISNSAIATLNLGSIVGDINSSIQRLNLGGNAELGERFGRVTEAVTVSGELDDAAKKDVIEHIAFVSGEEAAGRSEKDGSLENISSCH